MRIQCSERLMLPCEVFPDWAMFEAGTRGRALLCRECGAALTWHIWCHEKQTSYDASPRVWIHLRGTYTRMRSLRDGLVIGYYEAFESDKRELLEPITTGVVIFELTEDNGVTWTPVVTD